MQLRASARRAWPVLARRWSLPVAVGLALSGALVILIAAALWVERVPGWAFDFDAYYSAALRLLATGSPYQPETLAGPFRPTGEGMYLYSPAFALAVVPLTWVSPAGAAIVWLAIRLVALGAMCWLMPVTVPIRLASFGIAAFSWPFLHDMNIGNVSVLVTFLAVVGWRSIDGPSAGIAVAVASALRPTMAIIGLAWIVRRRWRTLAASLIAGAVLVAITLPAVGLRGWLDYATLLRNVSDVTGIINNGDIASAVVRVGLPEWSASIALVAGMGIAVVAVVLAARRERELGFVVATVASLLVSPVLWSHYLMLLSIPAAFLAARGRTWGLALPLLGWLPATTIPLVVLAALWLPFLARPRAIQAEAAPRRPAQA